MARSLMIPHTFHYLRAHQGLYVLLSNPGERGSRFLTCPPTDSPAQMAELFADHPRAVANTVRIAQMCQGLVAYRATGAEIHRPYFLGLLAEAYGKVGQPEEGLTVLVETLETVNKTEERNWEAELHRGKGELLLMQQGQKVGEAEECFRQALDTARRQQAKSFELRAALSLGRLWARQGKRKEARELLTGIYSWFTEGIDTPDLVDARALLDDLSDD